MLNNKLTEIYDLLSERFGPQNWWPAQTKFEIIIGAILTQNTNWTNVEKAIANLKADSCLDPDSINNMPVEKLAKIIKPAGYFNIKAKRIKNFIHFFFEYYQGQIENFDTVSTSSLREQLLGVKGIGPETADSILLYALERDVFVVDTYTARFAIRHKLIEPEADYFQIQYFFEENLPKDRKLFNDFHALIVMLGKEFCKPKPKCLGCPLERLPHQISFDY